LIYAAMLAYLATFITALLRKIKPAQYFFLAGFLIASTALFYRWVHVWHIPMQNLFEVFLCLGVVIYPVSIFSYRVLRIGAIAADMLIGVIVLFPAGFIFSAEPLQLPPALQTWLFGPHVFVYMLSYVLMAKAAVQAFIQLLWHGLPYHGLPAREEMATLSPEEAAYRMICAGFPLLTLGLILGSFWGQQAWGDWWSWDPKELWSLASWLIYVGFLHFRYMFAGKFPRINSLWAIAGLAAIIITLLWVNLSRLFPGLHNYAM